MEGIIRSASGPYNGAIVTDEGQLLTYSTVEAAEESAAANGDSFVIKGKFRTAAATNGLFLSITNNEQDYEMRVTRIYIYPQTLQDNDLICQQLYDPIVVGGSDVSAAAIMNKSGSSKIFDLTVIGSDASADATFSGGNVYHEIALNSRQDNDRAMNGTNIRRVGKSIAFAWYREGGAPATDNQIVYFSINVTKNRI